MKALIIAAGEGSRLRESNQDLPKPLLKIAGIPLIERIILTCKLAGVKDFVIVIGYKADEIKHYLNNGEKLGVGITYVFNKQWKKKNGVSVLCARPHLQEPFFLLMSDHLIEVSIMKAMINASLKNEELFLGVDYRLESDLIDKDDVTKVREEYGLIKEIGKEVKQYNCYDTGVFLATPALFDALKISKNDDNCSLSDGVQWMAKKNKARAIDIGKSFWIDVDTAFYADKAEKMIVSGKLPNSK